MSAAVPDDPPSSSAAPLVAIGARGVRVAPPGPAWGAARAELAARHVLRLPKFMDDDVVARAREQLSPDAFQERYDGVTLELRATSGVARGVLLFLVNEPALFAAVRDLTGCAEIGCFNGRVYRLSPGARHEDQWHEDLDGLRLVGLSVNLGAEPYQGGVFHIRQRGDDGEGHGVPNVVPGDALLFRIDEALQHRVTAVTGAIAKTAFAGWFSSGPRFEDVLLNRRA